jgi:hypothetical protein
MVTGGVCKVLSLPALAPPGILVEVDGICPSVISSEVSPRQHAPRYWRSFALKVFVFRRLP